MWPTLSGVSLCCKTALLFCCKSALIFCCKSALIFCCKSALIFFPHEPCSRMTVVDVTHKNVRTFTSLSFKRFCACSLGLNFVVRNYEHVKYQLQNTLLLTNWTPTAGRYGMLNSSSILTRLSDHRSVSPYTLHVFHISHSRKGPNHKIIYKFCPMTVISSMTVVSI